MEDGMVKISQEFKSRLKLCDKPAYKIANEAGVNPTTLSKLINGIEPVKPNDERINRVAAILGISPDKAFEATNQACA
jgi:transcriptional regulator with XRE-family HTH domain